MAKLRVNKIAAPIVKDEYTGSVYFDGTGDYLSVTDNGDFDASGDFTIEFWANLSLTDSDAWLVSKYDSVNNRREYIVTVNSSGDVAFYWSTDGSTHGALRTGNGTITAYKWNHYAWVKKGSVLTGYINGVALAQKTDLTSQYNNSVTPLYVGSLNGSQSFTGYISNLRICKGHAVYDGNFTVPTRELEVHTGAKGVVFPAADNRTVLLACQDAYNPLTDATGRHTITGAGNLGGVPGQNLVTNGDFHSNSNWDNYVSPTTSEISTDQSYDGTNSWKIVADEALDGISQTFSSNSFTGRKYVLSGYLYSSTGYARIRWRNGADGAWLYDANVGNGTANVWQKFEVTATESNGGSNMGVRLTANGSGTFYFDRISVVAVHPVTDANPGLLRKTNTTSTITETTGSVYFDGGDDGLRSNPYDELTLGTGSFTIECWFWRQNITSSWQVLVADNLYQSAGGWSFYTRYDDIYFYKGGAQIFVVSTCYSAQTWTHIAVQRDSAGSWSCYINGIDQGVSATDNVDFTNNRICIGTNNYNSAYPAYYNFIGYISNVRICKGHTVYKSNFIPSTKELEVHPETVFLACYDGENVFAEKTGKIIAANGDRTSSPTPTATDRPIGSTTVTPGLTREVDPTEGPTFGGGAGFVSQNWLTLPKGTTTERMPVLGGDQSGTRGFFAGAYSPTRSDVINYVTVPTLGNAIDFGNLGAANGGTAGFSDSTRGWIAGGNIAPTVTNVMEYVTMASSGNAVDGGDLITATGARPGSVANSIRGIVAGGSTPGQVKTIVHHTIQTTGIVQDFGDLTEVKSGVSGVMSPTRGVFAGGRQPGAIDTIEYVTMASTGNAVLFGELSLADRGNMGGASNTVRGLYGGGRSPTDHAHIEYITIATLGDAQDFGDLTQSGMDGDVGAVSNSTRVVFGGGASDELGHVEIATLGNTTQFGKFTVNTTANQDPGCFSSGHGGLG